MINREPTFISAKQGRRGVARRGCGRRRFEALERRDLLTVAPSSWAAAVDITAVDALAQVAVVDRPSGHDETCTTDGPSFTLDDGVLTVVGTHGDDRISAYVDAEGLLHVDVGDVHYAVDNRLVKHIQIDGGCGDDFITLDASVRQTACLAGGQGNDWLAAGRAPATLSGGSGHDTIYGGRADDVIRGGAGHDLIFGGAGHDKIGGGQGNDTIHAGAGNDFVQGGLGHDVIYGNAGDDVLYGDPPLRRLMAVDAQALLRVDVLGEAHAQGIAGHLTLRGGNDFIDGGAGHDSLNGMGGHDTLYGGRGDDSLSGGAGHDALYGGAGDDRMFGDSGNDLLRGGVGNDVLDGGVGNDSLHGGRGDDHLDGGRGNDLLAGGPGADSIWAVDGQIDRILFDLDDDLHIDGIDVLIQV